MEEQGSHDLPVSSVCSDPSLPLLPLIPSLSCSDQALLGPKWTLWLSWLCPWDLGSPHPRRRSQQGLEYSLIPTHIHGLGLSSLALPSISPGFKHLRGSFLKGTLRTLPHPGLVPFHSMGSFPLIPLPVCLHKSPGLSCDSRPGFSEFPQANVFFLG